MKMRRNYIHPPVSKKALAVSLVKTKTVAGD